MPTDLRVGIVGSRGFSRRILHHLLESGWTVPLAIGAAGSRSTQQVGARSFADLCDDWGVELLETSDIAEDRVTEALRMADLDLAVCCGWTQIVPERVRLAPEEGFLGVHASPLPEGRGGAPVNWQLIKGRDEVGVTLFEFVSEVDHGDIYGQTAVPVGPRDDVATVYGRLAVAACDVLDEVLPEIAAGTASPTPQSFEDATYWPQRTPADGLIEWDRSARALWNWIRALTEPYPGAFTFLDGEKLIVREATPTEVEVPAAAPGEILDVDETAGVAVCAGGQVVRLERCEYGHYPPVWADDLADRLDLNPGDRLGTPDDFPDWLYTGIRDADGGFSYETNAAVGDTVGLSAVCLSHQSPRTVGIRASLDGRTVFDREVRVDGWVRQPITVEVEKPGAQTLSVRYSSDGAEVDARYLKLYGHQAD